MPENFLPYFTSVNVPAVERKEAAIRSPDRRERGAVMSTMGQAGREALWDLGKQDLIERIFVDSAQPVEPLVRALYGPEEGDPLSFGAAGLYGRTWDSLDREMLFDAFPDIFFHIALPELTLMLIQAEADCRETAEGIAGWLRQRGLTANVAYLPGRSRLTEARQVRAAFESAAADMFFRGPAECLPLEPLIQARKAAEPREEELRQLRQDLAACLVRGEGGCVHEKLEKYFRISAQGSPSRFREYCAGLYFRVSEELTGWDEMGAACRGKLLRSGKTVFQLMEEANCAEEAKAHMSWYMDRLLEWYRPLRETTGRRVTAFVEEYIRNHYMEPVAIEEIAARVGLSANYVRSIFKNSRGQTIQSYLSEYRLEMACQLLRNTPVTVSKAGQMVGYNNVSYFCASFQKRYGKTPSEWRRDL